MPGNISDQYEHPLPEIKLDIEKIKTRGTGIIKGTFSIFNSAEHSVLTGFIKAMDGFVTVSPENFTGNCDVFYTVDTSSYCPGDIVKSSLLIVSNGGELLIPIEISVTAVYIPADGGGKLYNLSDFACYAEKSLKGAKNLFASNDFYCFIKQTAPEYCFAYEYFIKDINKDRGLENFLLMTENKKKVSLEVLDKDIKIIMYNNGPLVRTGSIGIRKTDWGYLECSVIKPGVPWIHIMKESFTSFDFNRNNIFHLTYQIDASFIKGNFAFASVGFSAGTETVSANIIVKKTSAFHIALSKESYFLEDSGFLIIDNYSGTDFLVSVWGKDTFIRFESKQYMCSSHIEIPFQIKLNPWQVITTRIGFRKIPVSVSEIYVRINNETKTLKITAGNIYS